MYCKNCGKEIDPNQLVCGYCGFALASEQISDQKKTELNKTAYSDESLKPNRSAGVRGFGIALMILSGILDIISMMEVGSGDTGTFTALLVVGSISFFIGLILTFAFR